MDYPDCSKHEVLVGHAASILDSLNQVLHRNGRSLVWLEVTSIQNDQVFFEATMHQPKEDYHCQIEQGQVEDVLRGMLWMAGVLHEDAYPTDKGGSDKLMALCTTRKLKASLEKIKYASTKQS